MLRHIRENLPIGAVAYLNDNKPEGRLFNPYNWGAYLLWALPGYPVFVDGRTDLYNDEIINKWLSVVRVEDGWQDILEEYDINLVLIEPGSMLDRTLAIRAGMGTGVPGCDFYYLPATISAMNNESILCSLRG